MCRGWVCGWRPSPDLLLLLRLCPHVDYCSEVLPQLSDNIRKAVEEAYKPHVTMEASCDGFLTLQASALNVLVRAG